MHSRVESLREPEIIPSLYYVLLAVGFFPDAGSQCLQVTGYIQAGRFGSSCWQET